MMRNAWDRLLQRLGVAAGMMFALALPATADLCDTVSHDGQDYVLCAIDAGDEAGLRLWLDDDQGQVYGSFARLKADLPADEALLFAMNAGMFHRDYQPVGLFVADGRRLGAVQTRAGGGNFGLLPNGIFCAGGAQPFAVIESKAFLADPPDCRLATQSGPMLVINGELHPRFLVDATSRYIRNGVGVSSDGRQAWFAISRRPVTFHEFGRLFRDRLGAQDALYFDGSLSQIYAPGVGRADRGRRLGPIIGLVGGAQDQQDQAGAD